jgi:probable F420-dependent oxidoreductase
MQIGVLYPSYELPTDPGAIRAYTQAVEDLGYDYITFFDHVILASTASRPDFQNPNHRLDKSPLHEPFVLAAFMAAASTRLGFSTSVLVLSQRQTALAAKQAASLDILCGGRLRVGVGTGWAELEYQALGVPWKGRGRRMEEQVELLRQLWTNEAVAFEGQFHSIPDMGVNPLPVQRPIPIWFGGGSGRPDLGDNKPAEHVMRRIARLGDGWIPQLGAKAKERAPELFAQMCGYLREYGRDPKALGIEHLYRPSDETSPGAWGESLRFWEAAGVTHVSLSTQRAGLNGTDAHIRFLEEFRRER